MQIYCKTNNSHEFTDKTKWVFITKVIHMMANHRIMAKQNLLLFFSSPKAS